MSKHHKKGRQKKPKTIKSESPKSKVLGKKKKVLAVTAIVGFIILFFLIGFSQNWFQDSSVFEKHGELTLKSSFSTKTIEIEIVETEEKIRQGLMYRSKMREDRGMLFIFPDNKPRSFWMKNTILPLDIVFIGEDKTVVAIQANTTPFSKKSLPSNGKNAKYVLEVNAGFMKKFGFKEGDTIDFNRRK